MNFTHVYDSYDDYLKYQLEKTSNPTKQQKWKNDEWRLKIDIFSMLFKDFLSKYRFKNAICLGSRTGQEVVALQELGIPEVKGIDLHPFPPYTEKGDIHEIKYNDETFELVFTNILDHSLYPDKFANEIYRILKPNGFLILHYQFNISQDKYTEVVFTEENKIVDLFKKFSVHSKRHIKSGKIAMNKEIIFQKQSYVKTRDLLTIIITASYISSHPSIKCMKQVIDSLDNLNLEIGTKVILAHDYSSELDYIQYIENLNQYISTNGKYSFEIVIRENHGHLTGNLRNAISYVNTKFVLVIQHDLPFIRNIDITKVINDMNENSRLKHIRFNKRKNIKAGDDARNDLFGKEIKCRNFSYIRTPTWSDQNHLCLTSYYTDIVMKECSDGKFMEKFLRPKINSIKEHNKYGTYLFDVLNADPYIFHLDGKIYVP